MTAEKPDDPIEVSSTHSRNPLLGWDITATAKAGAGQKIQRAQVLVNDFTEYDESFDPPVNSWQQQLQQKGDNPPSDNQVRVVVTNQNFEDTIFLDSWTGS